MSKKYKLTDESVDFDGLILRRIVALKDFGFIKKGAKGGWVEKEENLSQEGNCWIYDEAKVYGKARVYGDALVYDRAQVYEGVQVYGYAQVFGDAYVYNNAQVYGEAHVRGEAQVCDDAQVYGEAEVYGNAIVSGKAKVYDGARVARRAIVCDGAQVYGEATVWDNAIVGGEARVCEDARVRAAAILRSGTTESDDDYVVVGPQGSRHAYATYHIPSNTVSTGCFVGTLEEFETAVEKKHKRHQQYLLQYKQVIRFFNLAKSDFSTWQKLF